MLHDKCVHFFSAAVVAGIYLAPGMIVDGRSYFLRSPAVAGHPQLHKHSDSPLL